MTIHKAVFCYSDIWREVIGNVLFHHASFSGTVHIWRNQWLPFHLFQVRCFPLSWCFAASFLLLIGCPTMFWDAGCVSLELEKVTCLVCWPWFIIKTAHQFQPCWSAYVQSHIYCTHTNTYSHTFVLTVESESSFDNSHALLWFLVCCHHCHTLCWRNTKPNQLCFLHQLSVIRSHYCWPGVLSLQETQHVPTHQGTDN